MSDSDSGGSPRQTLLILVILIGGGLFAARYFEIDELSDLGVIAERVSAKSDADTDWAEPLPPYTRSFGSVEALRDQQLRDPQLPQAAGGFAFDSRQENAPESGFGELAGARRPDASGKAPRSRREDASNEGANSPKRIRHGDYPNITIGSWALDGFGPSKLANQDVRHYVAKIVGRFDVLALQQVAAIERDLIPRLVEEINRGEKRYDFVLGRPTGPRDRAEQLAFIFDTTQVEVDRRNVRSLDYRAIDNRANDNGAGSFHFAPLVACFRAKLPPRDAAWTFTVVNVRVDLPHAADEVAKLPDLMRMVAADGRGEDDIVLAGLMQADDAYLGPTFGRDFWLAVRHRTTDIYDRYQTGNLIIHSPSTTEAIGRGGVFNFPLHYKLNESQAEAITSHLPLYADFTAHEGGDL